LLAQLQSVLLAANTLAGTQVEISRSDAFTADDATAIALYVPLINREWLGDSPVSFKAKLQTVIVGVVYRPLMDDCTLATDQLRVQIENAVFCTQSIWSLPIERVNSSETTISFPSDVDTHQGIIRMVMECETTEIWPALLASQPAGNPPGAVGAAFALADLSIPGPAPGETLIGADIVIPTTGA
jgi:hypothetical protein